MIQKSINDRIPKGISPLREVYFLLLIVLIPIDNQVLKDKPNEIAPFDLELTFDDFIG